MDEEPKPKRKRGRPPGTKNKPGSRVGRKKGEEMRPHTTVELEALPGGKGSRSLSIIDPTQEGMEVPSLIAGCIQIRQGVDLDNPATLWNALEQYIQLCAASGMKITNSFLYLACGVSRQIVSEWYLGNKRNSNPEYRRFATMAKEICAAAREQYGIEGKTNPILTIFHQKFYDGFRDDPGTESYSDPLGEIQDPQKLAEKYKDLITD